MKFGSVCSGIEAASVAWHPLGWRAAWVSEIEPFPCALLAHHYPDVPNLGDMTKIARAVLAGEVEAPDVFTGGTPCQAFSVAGLRKSLDDDRGNLSLKFVELANAIDHVRGRRGLPASIIVWENVPGVLSTKDNAFGCFLAGLAGEDGELQPPGGRWEDAGAVYGPARSVAWRTLDAQYFGLAQRRRRVFVVASARGDFDPAAVLFEWQGVRRDTAPSREAGEGSPAGTLRSTDGGSDVDHARARHVVGALTSACGPNGHGGSGLATDKGAEAGHILAFGGNNTAGAIDVATACNAHGGAKGRLDFESETFVAHTLRGNGFDAREDGTGRGTPLVPVGVQASQSGVRFNDTIGTLDANYGSRRHNGVMVPMAFTQNSRSEVRHIGGDGQIVGALAADAGAQQQNYVAFHPTQDPISSTDGSTHCMGTGSSQGNATIAVAVDVWNQSIGGDLAGTLNAESVAPNHSGPKVMHAMQVRRLTPRECERLQGFPDDYTLITYRNKPAADGPRYKALGNSWAVPVVRWIGRRVEAQLRMKAAA